MFNQHPATLLSNTQSILSNTAHSLIQTAVAARQLACCLYLYSTSLSSGFHPLQIRSFYVVNTTLESKVCSLQGKGV
jgi:hypothetical protein